MKKVILTYGLIAGSIVATVLFSTTYIYKNNPNFELNAVIGFTGMFVAFIFIFLGIKKYRDQYVNGVITFKDAFKIGFLIALIASSIYVTVWLFEYYFLFPDFMDRYVESALKNLETSNLSKLEIMEQKAELAKYKEWYKNPIMVILMTFMEILPLGTIVALISALILKKKDKLAQV